MRIDSFSTKIGAFLALAAVAPGIAAAATCTQTVFRDTAVVSNIQNDIYSLNAPTIAFDGVRPDYLGQVPGEAFLSLSSGACALDFVSILVDDALRPDDAVLPPSRARYKIFHFQIPVDDEFDTVAYADGEILRLEILSDGGEFPSMADFDPVAGFNEFFGFGVAEVRLSRASDGLAPLAAIPLPAGAGLLGAALGGLALGARRRSRLS